MVDKTLLVLGGAAVVATYLLTRPAAEVEYSVLAAGVDETKSFVVTAVGEPKASLVNLLIECVGTDGLWHTYNILAGQLPSAVPGAGRLRFPDGAIYAKNVGTLDGNLFIRIKDDTGKVWYDYSSSTKVGETCWNHAFNMDMPTRNFGITIEVGH